MPQSNPVPVALVPGYGRGGGNAIPEQNNQHLRVGNRGRLDGAHSYEDLHGGPGSRSPSESERSNFTSVSQRGINPRWPGNAPQMPPMQGQAMGGMRGGPGGYGGGPRRGPPPQQQRNDVLLESNPDFGLPGMGPRNRRPVGGGPQGGNQGRFAPSLGQPQGLMGRSAYDQSGGAL